jgi:hypothetical protein
MPFVLFEEDPSYFHPVNFEQVTAEGERIVATFDGRFRSLDQARTDEIMREVVARGKELEEGRPVEGGITDQSLAMEVLDGWRNLIGPDGAELPFTEASKALFLRKRGAAGAIVSAWFESITNKPEARQGN